MDVVSLWGPVVAVGVVSGLGSRIALRQCGVAPGQRPFWYALLGMAAAVWVGWSLQQGWHITDEVRPNAALGGWRMAYFLSLTTLLVMVTATDFAAYLIVVWTCWLGILIGLAGAVISGDFQLAHVWVDWNQEIPQISGPYLPGWLSSHPHLHGLAWSAAGIVCGTVLMAVTRGIASLMLGRPALGSGDVYLMAMIGAYLGWQPSVVVVLLAPILALAIGIAVRLAGSQAPLPYGPFLALGGLITLTGWRWIWMAEFSLAAAEGSDRASTFAVRRLFGDPVSMLIVAGLSGGMFVLLLGLLRIYKSITLHRRQDG